MVFLIETKINDNVVRDTAAQVGYEYTKCVSPLGLSGGLAVLWDSSVSVVFSLLSARLMDCYINKDGFSFYISFVYGNPNRSERHIFWEQLQRIGVTRSGTWLLCGDFNEILHPDEKRGGRKRSLRSTSDFQLMTSVCGISDLPHSGNNMTWIGRRRGYTVGCYLDRALANQEWKALFPASEIKFLDMNESDHRPAIISISASIETRKKHFRFDSRCCFEPYFLDVIKQTWTACPYETTITQRLKQCRYAITSWKRGKNLNAAMNIKKLRENIDTGLSDHTVSTQEINAMRVQLANEYRREEIYWHQKSRNLWLSCGDRNTRYYHAATKNRRARNSILSLQSRNGTLLRGNTAIAREAKDYFSEIFTSSRILPSHEVVQTIPSVVTPTMNSQLIKQVTDDEIRNAVFGIGNTKAPGPDGFTSFFYQTYWEILRPQVTDAVHFFFQHGTLPYGCNHSNICLIPKISNPISIQDFRPISLCNVLYKVISKILVGRLKPFMASLVSENQVAYTPGRYILDNVFIAHEAFHALKSRRKCANEYMAVKTDVSKAYDRLEWPFLQLVLEKKGFHQTWITWIMNCIRSVSYSVLINGSPYHYFQPTRGLRQGDPLSPYLFILASDVLSSLITEAQQQKHLQCLRISHNGPAISHLLFADDSLFFIKADQVNCNNLLHIFKAYKQSSSQMINLSKSTITFGSNVYHHSRQSIQNLLGITTIGGGGKYLGLPEQFSQNRTAMFRYICTKVHHKLSGWQTRFLSNAGKEVLIKSVALSMPVYSMNCFQLPITICNEIDAMLARFWWGTSNHRRKMAWFSWKRLSQPKASGGLGFRDLHRFNQALLAGQVWKLYSRPSSFLFKLLKHRYFKNSTLFEASLKPGASYGWQSLLFGAQLLVPGLLKRIGDGTYTVLSDSTWLPCWPPRAPHLTDQSYANLSVSDLIHNRNGVEWDELALSTYVEPQDHHLIRCIYLPQFPASDSFLWRFTRDGIYSTKSGYNASSFLTPHMHSDIIPVPISASLSSQIWKSRLHPKMKHFLWRLGTSSLAVSSNLIRRHIQVHSECIRGDENAETELHLLFECLFAQIVWFLSGFDISALLMAHPTVSTILPTLLQQLQSPPIDVFSSLIPFFVLWRLWKARNILLFQKKYMSPQAIWNQAYSDMIEWYDLLIPNNNSFSTVQRRWQPPQESFVKCNVDFSGLPGTPEAGLGWILKKQKPLPYYGEFNVCGHWDFAESLLKVIINPWFTLSTLTNRVFGFNSSLRLSLNGQDSSKVLISAI